MDKFEIGYISFPIAGNVHSLNGWKFCRKIKFKELFFESNAKHMGRRHWLARVFSSSSAVIQNSKENFDTHTRNIHTFYS